MYTAIVSVISAMTGEVLLQSVFLNGRSRVIYMADNYTLPLPIIQTSHEECKPIRGKHLRVFVSRYVYLRGD